MSQDSANREHPATAPILFRLAATGVPPVTTTCLINSYNYGEFVADAVASALQQTQPFDQIIVVDDGSADGSLERLEREFGHLPLVEIVGKRNEGQLSCFNAGFARSSGDIVFFLDADDVYEPTYLAQALEVYRKDRDCDFLFCGIRYFGDRQDVSLRYPDDRDLGYSVIYTTYLREWIGGVTSTLSMRRSVLERILPLPFADEWRTRADDCLVFGSSLVGARKRFLAKPLVRYRVHSRNNFCGSRPDHAANYRRRLAINRLFEYLHRQRFYNVLELADFPHREFRTIKKPDFNQLLGYLRVSLRARVSLLRRLSCIGSMFQHYVSEAWQGANSKRDLPVPEKQESAIARTNAEEVAQFPRREAHSEATSSARRSA